MSKISLIPVNYFTDNDIYTAEVDNRPLRDLAKNIDTLNTELSSFGFYQEMTANVESEPPGGFNPYTCAYVAENGLLYPIDISTSVLVTDYSKYPIFLILGKTTDYTYKCISASTYLQVNELFNKFLPASVGKAVKIGPGGTLVDEVYFDLYFSSYNYQNIIVGKVLTPTSISFGGNQLTVLGNNRFLAKNKRESTTGVITFIRDTADSLVSFSTCLYDTLGVPYKFTEIQSYSSDATGTNKGSLPVYFSNTDLILNATTGVFTSSNLESLLNEVHFKSTTISAGTDQDAKYLTSGVNIKSLLGYATDFLLHSKSLSNSLSEISQSISTNLIFDNEVNNQTTLKFNSLAGNYGTTLDSTSSYPSSLLSLSSNSERGIVFGDYLTGQTGAFVSYVTDTNTSAVTDSTSGIKMSEIQSGYSLLIHSKNTLASNKKGAGNIFLVSDGYISLSARGGVFYSKQASSDFEIVNKKYVDISVGSVLDSAALKVPLEGNDSGNPITGQLYFDLKSNIDPSTVLFFDTVNVTKVKSTNQIDFIQTGGTPQIITAATPTIGASPNQVATVSYVDTAVAGVIPAGTYVRLAGTETITGLKTFTQPIEINNNAPLNLNITSGTVATINTNATTIHSVAKLTSPSTVTADAATTVVTKDYVDSSIASAGVRTVLRYAYPLTNVTTIKNQYVSVTNSDATLQLNGTNFSATGPNGVVYLGASPTYVNIRWTFNLVGVQLRYKGSIVGRITIVDASDNILDQAEIVVSEDNTNFITSMVAYAETDIQMVNTDAVKFKLDLEPAGPAASWGKYKQVIRVSTI